MTDLTRISIICTAEAALKKLKKSEICVYSCKKNGAEFIFSVRDKDISKVFAIFSKPCYNVKVVKNGKLRTLTAFLTRRIGLVVGAAAFIAATLIANNYVLKIEVSGSGSYLAPEVKQIIYSEGGKEFGRFSAFNTSVATGKILALPQVTFCNIQKRGSVLLVDVQVDEEHYGSVSGQPLISDADGNIVNIVAICGTAAVSVGDSVKKGDVLIRAENTVGEEIVECIAVGYAELECRRTAEYFAPCESEENLKNAVSSVLLDGEQIISRNYTVKPTSDGVIYVIDFTCLHKLSINLT